MIKPLVNKIFILLLACILTGCQNIDEHSYHTDIAATQAQAQTPTGKRAQIWWPKRHQQKLKAIAEKQVDLLFIGDSITHGWERSRGQVAWNKYFSQFRPFNLGFSADRTEHVLWRLQNGEVAGLDPKLAVVMIGTNNTGQMRANPEDTAYGILAISKELRQRLPNTKILLLAIFPRGANADDPLRQLNEKVNAIIEHYADEQHIFYLNINDSFLDESGELSTSIMPDLLHPNSKGYDIWGQEITPAINRLMSN